MFKKVKLDELKKLMQLSNVDIQSSVSAKEGNKKDDDLVYIVQSKVTMFDPDNVGDRGPFIKKSVTVSGSGKSLEEAQVNSLKIAQTLLGV